MATEALPADQKGWPLGLTIITVVAAVLLVAAIALALGYAPMEATMGNVQRIFYLHVGAAWAGGLAFLVTVVVGVAYLITRSPRWDLLGSSSVEVGLVLVTITLAGGMTWGAFAWGTPWTWDPKLTSFAVMWLSYAAYLMLRQGIDDPNRRARFAAIYGIVAFAGVIMTYFGARFIEATIHPYVVGESASTAQGDFGMTARMVQTMIFNFITMTFVYVAVLMHRIRLGRLGALVEQARARLMAEAG